MIAANVLKVALGLGLVIFLHELGHFLLAKWNGVKVEKFSIGFGPTLASFRSGVGLRIGTGSRAPVAGDPPTWGETEYILAALPLGGYVKMLGEAGEDAKDEAKSTDPRAYHNKPVFARMGIITAGVIMNVFLGIACFAFVHAQGGDDTAAVVGSVLPGSPAYTAGLRVGDDILAIDGRRNVVFKHLMSRVSLSKAKEPVVFTVKRPGSDGEINIPIEPRRDSGANAPMIGVSPARGLELDDESPFEAQPGMSVDPAQARLGFEGGDRIVAIGPDGSPPEAVADHDALARKLDEYRGRPLVVAVEREHGKEVGRATPRRSEIKVPVHNFLDFGLRLTPGPVMAIRPGSPAEKAGVKPKDRIVAVDGARDYDPMRLPDIARERAGKPMTLTIDRGEGRPIELAITPDASSTWSDPFNPVIRPDPLGIPGFGLALAIVPKVAAVAEGSPAAKAGIRPGEVIRSLILTTAPSEKSPKPRPVTFQIDERSNAWPMAFVAVQEVPWTTIELTTDKTSKPVAVRPEIDPARFYPSRGFNFVALTRPVPPVGFAEAIRLGFEETSETAWSILSIFKRLAERRISGFAFGGILPIAQIAYNSASTSLISFIHFLGIISVNLAVLNFMPIPPLDGGQFLFLAGEKIRGRPLPDSLLNFVTIGGVIFVLGLILVINVKDVVLLVQSYF